MRLRRCRAKGRGAMKSRTLTCITATLLLATLAPAQLAAQHSRYKLIDLGTADFAV